MTECQYKGCSNEVYSGGFCTVHTTDNGSQRRSFEVERFEKDLLRMIFSQIISDSNSVHDITFQDSDFDDFYKYAIGDLEDSLKTKYGVIFDCYFVEVFGVSFSCFNDDLFDLTYSHLKRFSNVNMTNCKFYRLNINFFDEFNYQDCEFTNSTMIFYEYSNYFEDCKFNGNTNFFLNREDCGSKTSDVDLSVFFNKECNLSGKILVAQDKKSPLDKITGFFPKNSLHMNTKVSLNKISFSEAFKAQNLFLSFSNLSTTNIELDNCIFHGRFEINEQSFFSFDPVIIEKCHDLPLIGKLLMKNVVFEDKFEIKKYFISSLCLENITFKKVVDFNKAKFSCFSGERVDFKEFFAFEDVQILNSTTVFKYTTFQAHATFRGTKFLGGLDLDRANFSGEANFLGVDADGGNITNTTRETYRLIKHSFDKIGNHLEANKFFAKEMDKYREEVSGNKSLPLWDRAVFHINKNVSDFGQNYLLSIGWLLLFMVGYFYTFVLHRHFGLIHNESSCDVFENGYDTVNCLASGMIPFKGFLTNGMELFSLVFYIIFAVLVWQTVVALKRHTRR